MRHLFVFLAFILVAISPTYGNESTVSAKDAQRITAATELIDVLNIKAQFEATRQASTKLASGTGDPQNLFEDQPSPDEWNQTKTILVQVYAKTFTTEELTQLVKLFKSPEGQIFAKKQGDLVKNSFGVMAQDVEKNLRILEEDKKIEPPAPSAPNMVLSIQKPEGKTDFIYKIGDQLLTVSQDTVPKLEQSGKLLAEFLEEEKLKRPNFKIVIQADKKVSAKELSMVMRCCADAGIDTISVSGVRKE